MMGAKKVRPYNDQASTELTANASRQGDIASRLNDNLASPAAPCV
jgi:hypothetical protein